MKYRQAVLGIAALAAFSTASAQETSGPYLGVGIGTLQLEQSDGDLKFDGDDTSFQVFGGYRINQWFAAELAYIDGGSPSDNILDINAKIDSSAFEVSLIGSLPLTDVFSLHARAGVLSWDSELIAEGLKLAEDDGTDFSYGIGASLRFGPSAEARIEARSADLDGTDMRLYVLSGLWKF